MSGRVLHKLGESLSALHRTLLKLIHWQMAQKNGRMKICFYALVILVLLELFLGVPRSMAWYYLVRSTVVGLTSYLGIIAFDIHKKSWFVKMNLVPSFVAFCFTAPLISLPSVIEDISNLFIWGGGEFGISFSLIMDIAVGGQIFCLLIPIQILICIFKKDIYKKIGYCIIFLGIFNVFTFFILLYSVGPILEYFLS